MKELRVLFIKGSKFETLWQHQSQVPLHLRELHITTDSVLKIPTSIGQLNQMEKIVLEPDKILGNAMSNSTVWSGFSAPGPENTMSNPSIAFP